MHQSLRWIQIVLKMQRNYKLYKAKNVENGWVYIGSTTSTVDKRKLDHLQKAQKGKGHYFQEAIATYGPEAFVWEQIDTASTINELASKEKKYIREYNSKEEGYNQDSGGGFKKLVHQYNLEGKLINTYNELQDAANAVNADKKSISAACLGKIKTCQKYYWSYDLLDVYKPIMDNRLKQVQQFDVNENFLNTFSSIAEASNCTGVNKSSIAKCCRKEQTSAGGFCWRY